MSLNSEHPFVNSYMFLFQNAKKWKSKSKPTAADAPSFFDGSVNYQLAPFTYNRFQNIVAFTLHVKNVEPDSIATISDTNSVSLKFTSIGSGYFPVHYAFYFDTDSTRIKATPCPEAWDNNLVIQIELDATDEFHTYRAGLSRMDCTEFTCEQSRERKMSSRSDDDGFVADGENIVVETVLTEKQVQIEVRNKDFDSDEQRPVAVKQKKSKKSNKKNRSFSESHCDDLKAEQEEQQQQEQKQQPPEKIANGNLNGICFQHVSIVKSRTFSESSNDDHHSEMFPLKGILKRHSLYDRQSSECSTTDEHHGFSCSVDAGIGSFTSIPEERDRELSESVRKTVRFDKQLCRKLLFK